ncbi:MAG: type II secretion system protein [Rubripirellula sp.]
MHSFQSSHKPRPAFTLIEVVVGVTLLASVLVSSILAFGAHHRQTRIAEAKLAAVAVADELMNTFISQPDGIPNAARGVIAGRPGWLWQTRMVGTARPAGVLMQVIQLQVIELKQGSVPQALATVEVVKAVKPSTEPSS